MGINCLFGHDFGPPETETEREQRGQEAIVTTREVKICRDCGARQILTENTAVVGRGEARTDAGTDEPKNGTDTQRSSETDVDATADSDMPAEATEASTDTAEQPTHSASGSEGQSPTRRSDRKDERLESGDREHHPTSSDRKQTSTVGPAAGSKPDTASLGNDEPDVTHDAVILGEESDDRDPMEWPDFGPASRVDAESSDGPETASTDPDVEPRADSATDSPVEIDDDSEPSVLYCENCSATWDLLGSSLLAGDPCPRCRSAYVTEQSQ